MHLIRIALLGVFFLVLFSNTSFASTEDNDFNSSHVSAFLVSQKDLMPLSDEMKAAGHGSLFKFMKGEIAVAGMPVFVKNVEYMKENTPEYYNKMTEIVANHSYNNGTYFSSAEEWAEIADRCMRAHFSLNSTASRTSYDDMKSRMPVEMMAMMSAEARKSMEDMLGMLKTFQNVSEHDRQVVKPHDKQFVFVVMEMR